MPKGTGIDSTFLQPVTLKIQLVLSVQSLCAGDSSQFKIYLERTHAYDYVC